MNVSPRVIVRVDSENYGVTNHAPNIDSKVGGIEQRYREETGQVHP